MPGTAQEFVSGAPCDADGTHFSARSDRFVLRIVGASMTPALWPGDVVIVRPRTPSDVAPGEIVVYSRDNGFIAHRVTARVGNRLIARGDAARVPDAPVANRYLLGVVELVVRNRRVLRPSQRRGPFDRVIGALVCHSDLARRILQRACPVRADNETLLSAIS